MATALWPGSVALLDETTGRELVLDPDGGWYVQELNLGHPVAREIVDNAPLADGTQDRTQFHGARAVALSLTTLDWDVLAARAMLGSFHHPGLRPVLRWRAVDGSAAQRMEVRPVSLDAVVNNPIKLTVGMTWTCPSGVAEGDELVTVMLRYLSGVFSPPLGLAGDTPFPLTFTGGVNAAEIVTVPGTASSWWKASVVGRVSDPAVLVDGATLFKIKGEVPSGTTLYIDGRAHTVVDHLGTPWYDKVDWAASSWAPLKPGVHELTLAGTPYSGASCTLTYRGAWL